MPSPSSPPMPARIDIHSHFLPPFYRTACLSTGHSNPDGMPALPSWSPEAHLSMMDEVGIARSILSVSSPFTHLTPGDDAPARDLTRRVNAYAAGLRREFPDRLGYFASLPLPDVRGSLEEIPRALAEGADGFVHGTNAHGHYLGDRCFDEVFEQLDARRALVFVHPTTPRCVGCGVAGVGEGEGEGEGEGRGAAATVRSAAPFEGRWPNPMLEFFFDTARVVANLFLGGTMGRFPNVRFVLPHLGGAFVPLLSRWTGFSGLVPDAGMLTVTEAEVREAFETRVWFDLAGLTFPGQIRATMAGAGVTASRMMYGSDFPFTRVEGVRTLRDQMDAGVKELFNEEEIEGLYHGNAEKLLAMK